MLIGIDPLLDGTLLEVLDHMGHGDQVAVVDRNYPAFSSGRRVVNLGAVSTTQAITAILRVLPLDEATDGSLTCMVAEDGQLRPSHREVLEVARARHHEELGIQLASRMDFYERAARVYAVVRTLDPRSYSCFILRKGVVLDPAEQRPYSDNTQVLDHGSMRYEQRGTA